MNYAYPNPQVVRGNGIGIAALVSGLIGLALSVVTGWIPIVGFFLILLPTLLAIIFGFIGRAQARTGAPHGAKATAGLTCGFVGLLLTVLLQACWGLLIGGAVISATEMADDMPAVVEVQRVGQEIQRQLERDWAQEAESRELIIPIESEASEVPPPVTPANTTPVEPKDSPASEPPKADRAGAGASSGSLDSQGGEQLII
jgi:hypothetical protein